MSPLTIPPYCHRHHLIDLMKLLICVAVGGLFWHIPEPIGVDPRGMKVFGVFLFTVLAVVLKPLPSGAICIFSLTVLPLLNVLSFEETFTGFANPVVWLITSAFFIARGFIKTGLGLRLAHLLIRAMGKNSLGIAYGMTLTDLLLAPAIPSVTARIGGIVYPVVLSIAKAFGSDPDHSPRRIGGYLIQTIFQSGTVTSAMFLTAMAGNPMVLNMVKSYGVSISWTDWAFAAVVPGLLSLLCIPYVLYKIYPPELKETPEAPQKSREELLVMGKLKADELWMLGVFLVLVFLWSVGSSWLSATLTALIGLALLLLSRVLSWEDVLKEKGAWDTLIWFATLLTLAGYITKFGLADWFGGVVKGHFIGVSWGWGLIVLSIIYFYAHYFFASNLAHIGALLLPFFVVAVNLGAPVNLTAFTFGFISSLFGSLTHFGSGPAPILYGSNFVRIGDWWKIGFLLSLVNILIWGIVGSLWWKLLGIF
ncbi:DASS family sodium-coupled anion symporter [bacterium]|jgi:DASS family divalent anion:Na+ symporter|nr:DASS family sodium-coupled anion symporter [bacterium]